MAKLYLFIVPLLIIIGCQEDISNFHNLHAFAWSPDGTQVVSIEWTNKTLSTQKLEAVFYNQGGQEVNRIAIDGTVADQEWSDRLYFTEDSNSIFAQSGGNIVTVSLTSGSIGQISSNEFLRSASQSGKSVFASLTKAGVPSDKYIYTTNSFTNKVYKRISTWQVPSTYLTYLASYDAQFIGDTLLALCYAAGGSCSVSLLDTSFKIIFSLPDAYFYSFASQAGKLAFMTSINELGILDLESKNISKEKPLAYIVHLQISPDGTKVVYSHNSKHNGAELIDDTLSIFNLSTGSDTQIATNVSSSPQISPDGTRVAYFTESNGSLILHVVDI